MQGTTRNNPRTRLYVIAAAIAAVLMVLPLVIPSYQTMLLSYGLILAMATLGFNLIFGYTGLLSFGHAAFFGVGAYTVAFMGRDFGFTSMEAYLIGGVLAAGVVALVFGFICVRLNRAFFAIMTLALGMVVWSLILKFFWVTGGTDGIVVKRPILFLGQVAYSGSGDFERFLAHYYYYIAVAFCVAVALLWVIVHSPFGKTLQAIRDNETRARFAGVDVFRYKLIAFVISGLIVGLAGALWTPLTGSAYPGVLYVTFSGKLAFLSVLGGFRTFTGPIVGALVLNYFQAYPITALLKIPTGIVVIAVILFLPLGIVGTLKRLVGLAQTRQKMDAKPLERAEAR